ncbi:MAG TPA: TonB-dependent receptor [Kofleriaceae bacterium]|nr:TonB-dependent receptor [Kofleriaceae bacterium]
MQRLGAALLVACAAPAAAWAGGQESLPEQPTGAAPIEVSQLELDSLLDLEVSAATKQPVKIADLPSTASAVMREQVLDYGWQSINDLLFALPGFAPSQSFERRVAGFRGESERWNSNRLLLSIDGMPHNNIETGAAFTWESAPLFLARKVEVVRGPASAVYGSNAMHGVIAVDTVSAADLGDGGIEARLTAGTRTQTVDAVGAQAGSWADAVVGFNAHRTDGDEYFGTDDSHRTDDEGAPALFKVQDERSSSYLWLKVEPRAAARGLEISIHRQTEQSETGHGWMGWSPDAQEYVRDQRSTVDLLYRHAARRVKLEGAAQYQREDYQSDIRLYPARALDGFYPQGVTEALETTFHSVFGRGQVELGLPRGASALGGVEYGGVLYLGDDTHYANAKLVDPDGVYPQLDDYEPLGDVYEPILHRPVHRVGVYAQAVSGALLGERAELTLGARYDELFYRYVDVASDARPVLSGSYEQVSPRAGLVVRPADTVRLKLMAGHAFRTPTIVELFASNSWTATSNPSALRPETMTTYEAAVDWAPAPPVRVRANAFYIDYRHAIDYGEQDGLLRNIFSNRRAGGELEILGQSKIGRVSLDGSASYSYVRLLDEKVLDPELSESKNLVWAPSHVGKAGVRASTGRLGGTATLFYQGKTRRRSSDRTDAMWNSLRPGDVPGWLSAGATIFYRPHPGIKVGVNGTNLFGTEGPIISTGANSFDYRTPPREILGVVELDL